MNYRNFDTILWLAMVQTRPFLSCWRKVCVLPYTNRFTEFINATICTCGTISPFLLMMSSFGNIKFKSVLILIWCIGNVTVMGNWYFDTVFRFFECVGCMRFFCVPFCKRNTQKKRKPSCHSSAFFYVSNFLRVTAWMMKKEEQKNQ